MRLNTMQGKVVFVIVCWLGLWPLVSYCQEIPEANSLPLIKDTSTQVDSLNQVADSLLYLQIRNPLPLVSHALQVSQRIGYKNGMALSYFNIAQVHRFITRDFIKANEYYDRSIELAQGQDNLIHGRCLIGKSAILLAQGEVWKARPFLLESCKLLITGNDLAKSLALEMRAHLFRHDKMNDSAYVYLFKALELQKKSKQPPRRIAYTLSIIASQSLAENDTVLARHYLSDLKTIANQFEFNNFLAKADLVEAEVLSLNHQYSKAIIFYLRCLSYEHKCGFSSPGRSEYYEEAGNCFFNLGNYHEAEVYLRKALLFSHDDKLTKAMVSSSLSNLFKKQSKIDSAFRYAEIARKIYLEMYTEGRANLGDLEFIYNSKMQNQENLYLKRSVKNERYIIIVCLFMLVSGSFASILLHQSRRRAKKMNRELAEKNDEISAQSEEIIAQSEELALHSHALEATNIKLKNLDQAGKSIIEGLNIEQIIDSTYHRVNSLLNITSFSIAVYNKDEERLDFPRVIKNDTVVPSYFRALNDSSCLQAWCFLNQTSIFVNNLLVEYQKYLHTAEETLKRNEESLSYIGCPLSINGQTIGVISVGNVKPDSFSDYDLDIVNNIANYVSIALENSKNYQQVIEEHSKLVDSNMLKDKLISIITHDIKAPLNSLSGFLSLLDSKAITPSESEVFVQRLREHFNRTLEMVDGVLVWTRSQMHGLKVFRTSFNVKAASDKVIESLKNQAEAKGITIVNNVEDDVAFADSSMAELVIRNLIANAIKFTRSEGEIIVSSKRSNNEIVVSVQDNGVGIPEESLKMLFQIDKRFTTYGTLKEKGTGLGLYLCKEFVTKNLGRIWVESSPGLGSKFSFSLPQEEFDTSNHIKKDLVDSRI